MATAYVAIKHIFPDLPANAGVMRPIDVRVPEGSLLSAEFPAPVGGYTETILRMIDVIFSAAAQAAPSFTSPRAKIGTLLQITSWATKSASFSFDQTLTFRAQSMTMPTKQRLVMKGL